MAKRARGACPEVHSKCRDQHGSIDRISMLPDGLLISILSLLPLKEATATSTLSHRWRYLWTFISKLDFDGVESILKVIGDGGRSESEFDEERLDYVEWVNHVLALHNGSTVEELRVVFNLTKPYGKYIDEWLRYALARKVQRLELSLVYHGSLTHRMYRDCYTFPYELLCTDKINHSNRLGPRSNSIDFNYLRRICTNYVNVSGEALEFFLCNCPLLEHLSVTQSGDLFTLRIIGPFASLKHLEIRFCHNLYSLEIRDAKNLAYLRYEGSRIHFLLEDVPLLVEMYVAGKLTKRMEDVIFLLSGYLPKLEKFTIEKMGKFSWKETEMFYSTVKMSSLKQLVVKVLGIFDDDYDGSLLPLTNLIRASPFLERFVLAASNCRPQFVQRKARNIVRSYPHLKEVEFVGYRGVTSEQELLMHFAESAAALEEILVDPRKLTSGSDYIWGRYHDTYGAKIVEEDTNDGRTRAKKLMKKVPSRINLKIL